MWDDLLIFQKGCAISQLLIDDSADAAFVVYGSRRRRPCLDSARQERKVILMEQDNTSALRPVRDWFQTKRVERTMRALEKNGFETFFVPDGESATRAISERIADESTVGIGGSMTLDQIGFFAHMKKRGIDLLDPFEEGVTWDERQEISRRIFASDVFVCSANAVTEEGHLYSIDGTGNRVAAMVFGPKRTIIVCGVNKIAGDMTEARKRAWQVAAPLNARRLGRKTPCAETGACSDCNAPDRICRVAVEVLKKPAASDILVIIVGEALGF